MGADQATYRQLVPAAAADPTPLPLIIVLHGGGTDAAWVAALTGFETLGEEQGAVVLTPQGIGQRLLWDVDSFTGNVDIDFLTRLIDTSEQRFCIDTARVFMAGMSWGGLMTAMAGCQLTDRIAAIGIVSGVRFPAECKLSRPVPVMAFYGKLDTISPYGGVPGIPSVETVLAQWATADGCQAKPETTQVSEHVERRKFVGCAEGSAVEFYAVSNGVHIWPGTPLEILETLIPTDRLAEVAAGTTYEISATPLLWDFWMQHPLAQ